MLQKIFKTLQSINTTSFAAGKTGQFDTSDSKTGHKVWAQATLEEATFDPEPLIKPEPSVEPSPIDPRGNDFEPEIPDPIIDPEPPIEPSPSVEPCDPDQNVKPSPVEPSPIEPVPNLEPSPIGPWDNDFEPDIPEPKIPDTKIPIEPSPSVEPCDPDQDVKPSPVEPSPIDPGDNDFDPEISEKDIPEPSADTSPIEPRQCILYDEDGSISCKIYYGKEGQYEHMEAINKDGSVRDAIYFRYDDNGNRFDDYKKFYDESGNIIKIKYYNDDKSLKSETTYKKDGSAVNVDIQEIKELAKELHDDVSVKFLLVLNGTRGSFDENVGKITPENVMYVLDEYKKAYGDDKTSLLAAMCGETHSYSLMKHVIDCVIENAKNNGTYVGEIQNKFEESLMESMTTFVTRGKIDSSSLDEAIEHLICRTSSFSKIDKPNGEIDKDFSQNNIGDCWFLAGIKSIANTPKGLDILNNSIKVNDDESVTVTLQGVGRSYTILPEELSGTRDYANGDADVRALEIAVEKYANEYGREEDILSIGTIEKGGYMCRAYEVLVGHDDTPIFCGNLADIPTEELIEKIKNPNTACAVGRLLVTDTAKIKSSDAEGEVEIFARHAYSVVRIDDEYVYIVNPWDTSKEIEMTLEDFKNTFDVVDFIEL